MAKKHANRLYFLLALLLLFLTFNFMAAILTSVNFIDLGLSRSAENLIVVMFSFTFVIMLVYDMVTL